MASVDDPDATLKTAIDSLGDDSSYTVHRLKHASPEHLYLTTRRCFIGPIPEGWLKSHRKDWYKHHLGIHHSSKAPTFSASSDVSRRRRLTGLDALNASTYRATFPQPGNVRREEAVEDEDDGEDEHQDTGRPSPRKDPKDQITPTVEQVDDGAESDGEATIRAPVALDIPRGGQSDPRLLKEEGGNAEEILSSYTTAHTVASPSTPTPLATPRPGDAPTDYMDSRPTDTFLRRETSDTSFVTASDGNSIIVDEPGVAFQTQSEPSNDYEATPKNSPRPGEPRSSASFETTNPATPGPTTSDTFLLASQNGRQRDQDLETNDTADTSQNSKLQQALHEDTEQGNANNSELRSPGVVRFNIPENPMLKQEMQVRARMAQGIRKSRISRAFTRGKLKDGEIVKVEKMLVRLDITTGSEQPNEDYDEKDSQRVETRTTEKWREFMVVCRESHEDEAVLCLQMYKTRVSRNVSMIDTDIDFAFRSFQQPTRARRKSATSTKYYWIPQSSESTCTVVLTRLLCYGKPKDRRLSFVSSDLAPLLAQWNGILF
jgi:hypothetical protein